MDTQLSVGIFAAMLVATLVVSYLGRRHEMQQEGGGLAAQGLNRWLVGLSAGATANSGFVVTAAVGLGYMYGMQWLVLPLGWCAGDIAFWLMFPDRINRVGAEVRATTLTDVVVDGVGGRPKRFLQQAIGLLSLVCLGGYVSAQWLAGQKFLSGAFGFSSLLSLLIFAAVIVVYSSLGGFRGSVYADTLQATIRIVGTLIACVAVSVVAHRNPQAFWQQLHAAGPDFLRLIPHGATLTALASAAGFGAAALGFGLGQPQMVTRYLAGASPAETRRAWWIYLAFVQLTWIAMTVFGVALRGVMPHLADPETGLSAFHRATTGPVVTGIIAADIFATIAATSNSILVAMGQTLTFDLMATDRRRTARTMDLTWAIALLGLVTMLISLGLHSTVLTLALASVSLMGAGLAPLMIVRLLGWRRSGVSLLAALASGIACAAAWRFLGYSAVLNEAAPGIIVGLVVNGLVAMAHERVAVPVHS